jgi:hypothetical protein
MTDEMKETQKTKEDEGTSSSNKSLSGSIMPGLFLIALGLVFLANNLTGFHLDNWWALFILFPAANNFNDAIRIMRRDGGVSRKARGQFFWSFFFVLLSAAFLLGISVGQYWPVFLILAGIGILIGAL